MKKKKEKKKRESRYISNARDVWQRNDDVWQENYRIPIEWELAVIFAPIGNWLGAPSTFTLLLWLGAPSALLLTFTVLAWIMSDK